VAEHGNAEGVGGDVDVDREGGFADCGSSIRVVKDSIPGRPTRKDVSSVLLLIRARPTIALGALRLESLFVRIVRGVARGCRSHGWSGLQVY